MMSVEVRGGGGAGGGIDPSNLHLKKELTQIRKAAKVLKDPGTSSTWRSPIGSARSTTKHHYVHHHNNGDINGNAVISSSDNFLQLPLQVERSDIYSNVNAPNDKNNPNAKEKEKRVFLYNWRNQKSESETSRQIDEYDVDNGKDEGSSSTQEGSLEVDSLIDARYSGVGNDSKSDTYLSDRYASAISKYKNANFTPSIRRALKKKSKRSSYSSASSRNQDEKSQKMQILLSRYSKNSILRWDELLSMSDETEDYCISEDLATISPLLAKFKKKGLLRSHHRKEDNDSISYSTPPLSTSSYNRYAIRKIRNPSTVESWTGSINDADDEVDDGQSDLGCGIPCYWSRRSTPKSRNGSCYSPSLSDTLRRKGSSIFCGSQRRHHNKRRFSTKTGLGAQSLVPLLTNSADVAGGSFTGSDDEVSTNLGELDLEALSRLDGRRWSSCRSQEGLEIVEINEESSPENIKSLSHKYKPMFFEELIGQNIVVQSLMNAVSKGRISPVYLFQGPRGTGKTSTARILAAALNCLTNEETTTKPCGVCKECADFMSGKNNYLGEVDGSNKKGVEKIKYFLKNISRVRPDFLHYKVFVVDECHLLPSKTWLAFLRLLEKPLPRVVFVLITSDADNLPRAVLSCCQKHIFNKISNGDIVSRLRKISSDEKLDVELNALELIASNADGSLCDAETMLDQLSLFGKRITKSSVNDLIGVVSEEKLVDLLELAMSSNATETVIRARELMDSGVDPIALMSQLVTLIVDIIAGTYPFVETSNDSFSGGRSLSERELDRLKHALTLLSEAEKHLRVSSERSTWFTATLLQLGSMPSPNQTHSTSSRRQSSKAATEEDHLSTPKELKQRIDKQFELGKSSSPTSQNLVGNLSKADKREFIDVESLTVSRDDSEMLVDIWLQCIEKCHSKTLRQLLLSYGKLVSISEMKDGFIAHIGFGDTNIKTRAEGFRSSITNSFEIVLQSNVDVKIILLQDSSCQNLTDETSMNQENTSKSFTISEGHQKTQSLESVVGNDSKSDVIPLRRIESIIHEQRLETAWLQAMDKGTPGSVSRLKAERNQVLPQDGPDGVNESEPLNSMEDELNHEIKALKINDDQNEKIVKRMDHCPISPSLLHNSNCGKDNMGYESGSGGGGCSGMFCWNNSRAHRRGKAKQGAPTHVCRSARFSWFGECVKSRTENRYNR